MAARPAIVAGEHAKELFLFLLGLVAQTMWDVLVRAVSRVFSSGWDFTPREMLQLGGLAVWFALVIVLSVAVFLGWLEKRTSIEKENARLAEENARCAEKLAGYEQREREGEIRSKATLDAWRFDQAARQFESMRRGGGPKG